MIEPRDYPHLVEFMSKCLFQSAAPTFEEAILAWKLTGDYSTKVVLDELDALLIEDFPEKALADFVWKYSAYFQGDSAGSTLRYIREVLRDSNAMGS